MEEAVESPNIAYTASLVGRKLGRYEILAKIASGGMASVYAARAQGVAGFERLVAIKLLHANLAHEEDFINMFLDEARLAARIRHPNVVPTLDISDSVDMGYYLVMEYIEGDHLGKLLSGVVKAGIAFEIPIVARLIIDILSGLGAAHSLTDDNGNPLNIVHRDISPHNIMVGLDGISRLTDFGVAKAENRLSHTRDGQIKGKIGYMAPENASKGISDARSDLFAVGIILWECLTCKRLFRAPTAAESLRKLLIDPIPLPSSVNEKLKPFDEISMKALSREPDERFQTAIEFIEAVEDLAKDHGGIASVRKIGKLVKQYASARIDHNKSLIRESIQNIGSSEHKGQQESSRDLMFSYPSLQSEISSTATAKGSGTPASLSTLKSGVHATPSGFDSKQPSQPHSDETGSRRHDFFDVYNEPSVASLSLSQKLSLSSISAGMSKPISRKKWIMALSLGCIIVIALAIWALNIEEDQQMKIIEIAPPASQKINATKMKGEDNNKPQKEKASINAVDMATQQFDIENPESLLSEFDIEEVESHPEDSVPEKTLDGRSLSSKTKKGITIPVEKEATEKAAQNATTSILEEPSKPVKTIAIANKKPRKRRPRKRKQPDTPTPTMLDELPATNPYLNKQ